MFPCGTKDLNAGEVNLWITLLSVFSINVPKLIKLAMDVLNSRCTTALSGNLVQGLSECMCKCTGTMLTYCTILKDPYLFVNLTK
jgi:hypothetical protein